MVNLCGDADESALFHVTVWTVSAIAFTLAYLFAVLREIGRGLLVGVGNAYQIVRTTNAHIEAVLNAPGTSAAHEAAHAAVLTTEPVAPVHAAAPTPAPAPAFTQGNAATWTQPTEANIIFMEDDGRDNKWYLVTVGPSVGVFRNWVHTGPLVLGYAQSVYCRVESRAQGIRQFNEALEAGNVRVIG